MKFHDYSEVQGLSLVTDDDGNGWRYEAIKPHGAAPLEATPYPYLRQGHYCANAIAQGIVIVGHRINLVQAEWKRLGAEVQFRRSIKAMT